MQKFYCLYAGEKFPQPVEELSDSTDETNFPQVVERLGVDIFSIPWGHHRTIIDKCKDVDI
jgi:hypothetical protein